MSKDEARPTVLVVDDERGPRESLRMILAPHHRVLQAESGAEALDLLRAERVDLVTLDLNMPGMKGAELMRTIRSAHPEIEIIVITGCGSLESATEGIRFGICDYLQKPFDVVKVSAAVARAVARGRARHRLLTFLGELGGAVGHEQDAHALLADVQRSQKLRGRLGGFFADTRSKRNGSEDDSARTVEFLEVLAETIETKDRFMRGHARRVAFYSGLLAERLGLSNEDLDNVRLAAFLHDLGKVGVPTDLLLRNGALRSAEREIVEQHPEIGARLLAPLDLPAEVASAVRHHHEWWDGTGYPDGVAGAEIPLSARIISVADAFDAMSCDRPYRDALPRDAIVAEFRRYAGVQFDAKITKAFLEILESGACDEDVDLAVQAAVEANGGGSSIHAVAAGSGVL